MRVLAVVLARHIPISNDNRKADSAVIQKLVKARTFFDVPVPDVSAAPTFAEMMNCRLCGGPSTLLSSYSGIGMPDLTHNSWSSPIGFDPACKEVERLDIDT